MIFARCFSNRARRIQRYRGEASTAPEEFFFCSGGLAGRLVESPLEDERLPCKVSVNYIIKILCGRMDHKQKEQNYDKTGGLIQINITISKSEC